MKYISPNSFKTFQDIQAELFFSDWFWSLELRHI